VKQGQTYAADALTYREKIAHLAYSFIKDDSVVLDMPASLVSSSTSDAIGPDINPFILQGGDANTASCA
jgi:hypothetical protein